MPRGQEAKAELDMECIYHGWEGRDWVGLDCWMNAFSKTASSSLAFWSYLPTLAPAELFAYWRGLEGLWETPSPSMQSHLQHKSYFSGMQSNKWLMGRLWRPLQMIFLGPSQSQRCKLMCLLSLHLHLLSHVPSRRRSRVLGLTLNHLPLRSHCLGFFQKKLHNLSFPPLWYWEPEFLCHLSFPNQALKLGSDCVSHCDVSLMPAVFFQILLCCLPLSMDLPSY